MTCIMIYVGLMARTSAEESEFQLANTRIEDMAVFWFLRSNSYLIGLRLAMVGSAGLASYSILSNPGGSTAHSH
jgi:hypothetical protein